MTSPITKKSSLGRTEFTALLAMSMALTAIGIDLMLPAFGAIRGYLGLPADSTAVSGLVTAYFMGLALGQLGYGPLADRFGRRPTLYVGYAIYALGALAAALSTSLTMLLLSRFVWGIGAAGPRVITLAVVRDAYEGEHMARVMSFIMAVFLLAPVVAPTLGATLVSLVSWRWLFGICVAAVAGMALWARRLPETLDESHRMPLSPAGIARAARFVVSDRQTLAYTLAMTALFGVFTSYIGSAEIIFSDGFGQEEAFPYLFGGLASFMGIGMLVNARFVGRFGIRRMAHGILVGYVVAAGMLLMLAITTGGRPPLWAFLVALACMLMGHSLLIPNFNTIAMAPMAHVAGVASAVIGAVQIAVGASLGALLDRAYDGTITPMAIGFLGYGLVAFALVVWAEGGRLFAPLGAPTPSNSGRRSKEASQEASHSGRR